MSVILLSSHCIHEGMFARVNFLNEKTLAEAEHGEIILSDSLGPQSPDHEGSRGVFI